MESFRPSRDAIVGCILGGAIGDAMGGPYEGCTGPIAVSDTDTWRLSDDTQLTLATCEAIGRVGRVDPEAIAAEFTAWFRARRLRGLGASTLKALRELAAGGHWALVGRKGEMAAGDGAAMRIAPLAFCVDPHTRAGRTTIRDVCRITHHSDEAWAGAVALLLAVRAAAGSASAGGREELGAIAGAVPPSRTRERLVALAQEPSRSLPEVASAIGCGGYAAEAVPLALYAAATTQSRGFEQVLRDVIAVGGDTDTIASMTGQVLGARLGVGALPEHLVRRLPTTESVGAMAERFAASLESQGSRVV